MNNAYTDNLVRFLKEIKQKPDNKEIEFELKLLLDKKLIDGKLSNTEYTPLEVKEIFKVLFAQTCARVSNDPVEVQQVGPVEVQQVGPVEVQQVGPVEVQQVGPVEVQQVGPVEVQQVNFVSKDGINKQFSFSRGVKIPDSRIVYSKSRIKDMYLDYAGVVWKAKACRERMLQTNDNNVAYNLIRFKRRFSVVINPRWRLDFTFVIQRPFMSTEGEVRDAKERLFLSEQHRLYDIAEFVEVEIEYIGDLNELNVQDVAEVLHGLAIVPMRSGAEYYDAAIAVLQDMFKEKAIRGDRRVSIKQLLPQTAALTKKEYFNMLSGGEFGNYYIAHKLDGERVVLFINVATPIGNLTGYLSATKWIDLDAVPTQSTTWILDCELYEGTFYVFDALLTGPNQLALYKCPYVLRRRILNSAEICTIQLAKSGPSPTSSYAIVVKPSHKLGTLYAGKIAALDAEVTAYPRDGIIFTSGRDPYLATNYYKWKPPTHMTIEFIAKQCPPEIVGAPPFVKRRGKTIYMLHVGIRNDMALGLGMRKMPHYHMMFPDLVRKDYYPIHFAPSNEPLAYLYWSDRTDLDNKIVEMIWIEQEWRLIKVRPDRQVDYLNHQYFGNDYTVAEQIWYGYSNPFALHHLQMTPFDMKKEFYFVEDNSEQFRGIRKFNNWVKTRLFETVARNQPWLIDIGAGKGQDFLKYLNLNVRNVIFADSNPNNIDDIIARKYTYHKQGHFRKATCSVNTVCMDVLDPKFVERVNRFVLNSKLIVCNFAIHYMCYNADTATQFAKVIGGLLNGGGRLLITYLDGRRVHERLIADADTEGDADGASYDITDGDLEMVGGMEITPDASQKYIIKKLYVSDEYTGRNQKIAIKLPFSDGFYIEHLFDCDLLSKALKPHKISKESEGDFVEFIAEYQAEVKRDKFELDADDLEYIKLLRYTIYYK
jgi:hypothetical protein